jgi:hypothetical protein
MPVGRAIMPRFVEITTANTPSTSVTPIAVSALTNTATSAILDGLEVEGLDKALEIVETKVNDGETVFDRYEVTVSGFIRGLELASSLTGRLNRTSSETIVTSNLFIHGAPGTLGMGFRNVRVFVKSDFGGNKGRTMFKFTRDTIYDANEATGTGGFVFTFTSSGS